jgi:anti-sigma regulatory factor (Ser/Thr protein kinase)
MRHDVAAVADFLGADKDAVENVRLAVSEAATSVVQSVFEHSAGRMQVMVATLGDDALAVIVSDDGHGVVQADREAGLGMGFIVMRDCADSLKLRRTPTGGIELDMRFALRPSCRPRSERSSSGGQPTAVDGPAAGEVAFHSAAT